MTLRDLSVKRGSGHGGAGEPRTGDRELPMKQPGPRCDASDRSYFRATGRLYGVCKSCGASVWPFRKQRWPTDCYCARCESMWLSFERALEPALRSLEDAVAVAQEHRR